MSFSSSYLPSESSQKLVSPLLIGREFMTKPLQLNDELESLSHLHQSAHWKFDLAEAQPFLARKKGAVIVTDPMQRILWTSCGFARMTGYSYCEAYGRKPSFLQGPATEERVRAEIREALSSQRAFEGDIINYRKSGELYTCSVQIRPVFDRDDRLVHFIALEEER